ncbi:transformer-2 protein homolog alpha-like isoform X2 [Lineus longissimus]|uniref:transformer-2 protein homolog alpha-like isoform X2 n=1 Tax=Lineus longissimus TaxID=88925 RepID=UPI002B4F7B47
MSDREDYRERAWDTKNSSLEDVKPDMSRIKKERPEINDSITEKRSHTHSPRSERSRSRSPRYSRSRSRSYRRSYSRSRSRSYGHGYSRRYSRSRSRSRSRSPRYRSSYHDRRRGGYYRSRSRSPMSNRRRHVGKRDEPEQSRCIGVFGLSLYTQEKDLREVLNRYGPIDEVQVVYDHQTGRSRGFAFVYFKNTADAVEAKERCNGQEIDGRRIRVDFSITERAHTPTPGIYLGKPTGSGYSSRYRGDRGRSPSPYKERGYRGSRRRYSRSRSRSYSPRRY